MKRYDFMSMEEFETADVAGEWEALTVVDEAGWLKIDLMTECKRWQTAVRRFFKAIGADVRIDGWQECIEECCSNGFFRESDYYVDTLNGVRNEYHSYSWEVEEINDGQWYIFLNVRYETAEPETAAEPEPETETEQEQEQSQPETAAEEEQSITRESSKAARVAARNAEGKGFLEMTAEERRQFLQEVEESARSRWQRERQKNAARLAYAEKKLATGGRLDYEEFYLVYGVKISAGMTGKMAGIDSLSTCCICNPACMSRLENGVGICSECFAAAGLWKRGLLENLVLNYRVLTEQEIPVQAWPVWRTERGRFESFGDIATATQARNYINCCRANGWTTFAWWTKNPWIIGRVLAAGVEKPENVTIILSDQFMDGSGPAGALETMLKMYPFVDKCFSVYTLKYAERAAEQEGQTVTEWITCGGRSCVGCDNCYLRAGESPRHIRELVKKDGKKVRTSWS